MNIGINLSMGMASFTPQLIELDEVYEWDFIKSK